MCCFSRALKKAADDEELLRSNKSDVEQTRFVVLLPFIAFGLKDVGRHIPLPATTHKSGRKPPLDESRNESDREFQIAQFASMSTPALMRELFRIHAALVTTSDPRMVSRFGPALRSAEGLVEQHLAGAEPQKPTSHRRS